MIGLSILIAVVAINFKRNQSTPPDLITNQEQVPEISLPELETEYVIQEEQPAPESLSLWQTNAHESFNLQVDVNATYLHEISDLSKVVRHAQLLLSQISRPISSDLLIALQQRHGGRVSLDETVRCVRGLS